jgi:diguanylate cyclase (GGDEF)-like protein
MNKAVSRWSAGTVGTQKRLVIVENDGIVARDLRETLEALGYAVVGIATSAKRALDIVEQHLPDLVLMDVRLNGAMDGIGAAKLIRLRYQLPVVYLTANGDAETLGRALESDPGGYLRKPFIEHTLRTTIEVAIRRHDAESALRTEHRHETAQLELQNLELSHIAEHFQQESTVDSLTRLYNRRHFDLALHRELSLADREGKAVGIILLDLDHFKKLNDTMGHPVADAVLVSLGALILTRVRAYDIACRYGGDEFVIVVPGTSSTGAMLLSEQLRVDVERLSVQHEGRAYGSLTASFGVAAFPEHGANAKDLFSAADTALYRAKAGGRNRVLRSQTTSPDEFRFV